MSPFWPTPRDRSRAEGDHGEICYRQAEAPIDAMIGGSPSLWKGQWMIQTIRRSSCLCGRVMCESVGEPIFRAVCYCQDCQEGGRTIEALPHAPDVLDADGGTPYLTYRDDRFHCVSGADLLTGFRLKDRSPTQRFVASCCNSGMFLKFAPGHWVSAYRQRFEGDLPPIEMRNQTRRREAQTAMPDDAPNYRGYPLRLFAKLIGARMAMLLGH